MRRGYAATTESGISKARERPRCGIAKVAALSQKGARRKFIRYSTDLSFDHPADAHLGHINLGGVDPERTFYHLHRPLLRDVEIEHLVLLCVDPSLDASQRQLQQVLLPFLFPVLLQIFAVRIRNPFDGRGPGSVGFMSGGRKRSDRLAGWRP